MKNILITGGAGFIGSNFINYMVPKYNDINFFNIDALYYCADVNNIYVNELDNYKFIEGNITDKELICSILKENNIDTIIHFAAQSHVDNSFNDSLQYTKDNILGTHVLLESVRLINKDIKFIHFSTDEVYGESKENEQPKNEMDLLCPTNPYAASKAAAEMLVISYIHSFNLNCIITRGNNVFGPNQYPEKLIPKFIKLLNEDKKLTIHGKGESLRTFIHCDDVSKAVETILYNGVIGETYNIGSEPENELSVIQVAKLLIKKIKNTDNYEKYIEYVKDRPFNDKRYFITNEKLKKLGWKQEINFEDGLNRLLKEKEVNLNKLLKNHDELLNLLRQDPKYQKYIIEKEERKIINKSFCFVILRHVRRPKYNQFWIEAYSCIRKLYPDNKIIIIDDNSNYEYITINIEDLHNVELIQSEFIGAGEFLPYYYYLKHNWAENMIFFHDSMYLQKKMNFDIDTIKYLYNFDKHLMAHKDLVKEYITKLNNSEKLLEIYEYKKWLGCFGGTSIINYNFLKQINHKFNIINLKDYIKTREDRMSFERIIAIICYEMLNKNPDTECGNILNHNRCYNLKFYQYKKDKYNIDQSIIKTWTGR